MPTYAYRCAAGHEFEAVQSILEEPLAACLTCGKAVRRVVFPVGIVFKGQGFYKTDSRSSGSSSTSPAAPAAAADKNAKPESKPSNGTTPGESSKTAAAPGVAAPSSSASSAGDKNG